MISEFIEDEMQPQNGSGNQLMQMLDSYVDNAIGEDMGFNDDNEPYIENRSQANYFLGLYKKAQQALEDNEQVVKVYLDEHERKAKEWLEQVNRDHIYVMDQIKVLLEDYTRKEITADSKKKSIKLINGTIGLRAQTPKYEYDDDTLREFLKGKHDELLIPQPDKIDHSALKKACQLNDETLTIDGEKLPGISVEFRADNFVIK